MRIIAIALLALLAGCVHLKTPRLYMLSTSVQATEAQCASIDNKFVAWTVTSVTAGAVGGGSSAVLALTTNNTARYTIVGTTVALSGLTAAAASLAATYSKRYTDQCTVNVGGK
jgi:hypothetical protein